MMVVQDGVSLVVERPAAVLAGVAPEAFPVSAVLYRWVVLAVGVEDAVRPAHRPEQLGGRSRIVG